MKHPRCRYCGCALYDNGPSSNARWSADWKARKNPAISWFKCYSRPITPDITYPIHEPLDILVQLVMEGTK